MTAKTVISLQIQQNIDLLQRVTLKSVDFWVERLKYCLGLGLLLGVSVSAQGLGDCLGLALTLSVRVNASA